MKQVDSAVTPHLASELTKAMEPLIRLLSFFFIVFKTFNVLQFSGMFLVADYTAMTLSETAMPVKTRLNADLSMNFAQLWLISVFSAGD